MSSIKLTKTGEQVFVRDNGKDAEVTLFFCHGNSLNSSFFDAQFNAPELASCRLVAFDLPGHGQSPKPLDKEATYSLPGYADVAIGVIEALDLKNPVLVGHSLGGHLCNYIASKHEDVRAIATFGAPPLGLPPAMDKAFIPDPRLALAFQGHHTAEEAHTLADAFVVNDEALIKRLSEAILSTDPNARAEVAASIGAGKLIDELEVMKGFDFPYAIWNGAQDTLVNLNYFSIVETPHLWKGAAQVIENTGHMVQVESARAFNAELSEFINDLL